MTQNPIKILIAGAKPDNRALLSNIFEQRPDIELVVEAGSGPELFDLTSRLRPHIAFIDTGLPDMDGMSAAKKLREKDDDLFIVLVTGHADFTAEAFEIESFDYILKPFTIPRIEKVLDKVHFRLAERHLARQKLTEVLKSAAKLYVKTGHELLFIDINTIFYVERDNKKTVIHTTDNRYETHESINDLERRLDKVNFFRSHKCYLINLKRVEKIIPWGDNSYLVKFHDSEKDALIARSKVKTLYNLLEMSLGPHL